MKKSNLIILILTSTLLFDGCSMIKKFWPGKKGASDDISYELIENLSTAFSEGKLQALEEMIAIYNDSNQPFDVRMAAGKALAETQHPTALNALSETVGDAAALDVSFMIASIELLANIKSPTSKVSLKKVPPVVTTSSNTVILIPFFTCGPSIHACVP